MVNVTAATSFLGNEGMWRAGETKAVSAHRAHELIEEGLVIEAGDQTPPSPLQAVADALGATVKTTGSVPLQAAADALGAKAADKPELPAVTLNSLKEKENKDKGKTKEDKAASERETKEDK